MDSPSCIRFLMKMLKTLPSSTSNNKVPTIGCKLLALRKNASYLQDINGADSTSAAIVHKVQEILVSCKQMKSRDGKDNGREKPELSPKWISLLTMEKACLSTISFEGLFDPIPSSYILFELFLYFEIIWENCKYLVNIQTTNMCVKVLRDEYYFLCLAITFYFFIFFVTSQGMIEQRVKYAL